MSNNRFLTGIELNNFIEQSVYQNDNELNKRDFVMPLVDYCMQKNNCKEIGIVFGLRSTGKTVGILQAAKELESKGKKAAYKSLKYKECDVKTINEEMDDLAKIGITHIFIDEATYLGGFVNEVAWWADMFAPSRKIKIIISGTDSFMLWISSAGPLMHRHRTFSTNRMSYKEYKTLISDDFERYRNEGGIFYNAGMDTYIRHSIADNLINTINHCVDDAGRMNYYVDNLYGISNDVVCKAVLTIFKNNVERFIIQEYANKNNKKEIVSLGEAIKNYSAEQKEIIKREIADNMGIYTGYNKAGHPELVMQSLLDFLERIDCLRIYGSGQTGLSDKSYIFTHNKLMNYALDETIDGIVKFYENNGDMRNSIGISKQEFIKHVSNANIGFMNECIAVSHILEHRNENEKIYKYRDADSKEIDIVVINKEAKYARLVQVKSYGNEGEDYNESKLRADTAVFFDDNVLSNAALDESYYISRELVYEGNTKEIKYTDSNEMLRAYNIKDFALRQEEIIKKIAESAKTI